MKKKLLLTFTIILTLCLSLFTLTACNNPTDNANVIMSKAVEKLDYVSKMMFLAMETDGSEPSALSSTNTETFSIDSVSNTTSFSARANNATCFGASTTIPSDITFTELWCGTVMERQVYTNYVYNVIDFLLQNKLAKEISNYKKFTTGEIIYGKANKTINQELNEFYADPTVGSPTMAIRVDETNNGIHFVVDWDWRGEKIATVAPMYNTVIMVDCDIEYDHQKHEINKISMTWQFTKDNNVLVATVMDFNKNEFYFMECYRQETWEDCSSKEEIVKLFNSGELTYEKISEYPYSGIMLVKSNITLSPSKLNFNAMWKQDSDLNSVGAPSVAENDNETRFANLYADIYEKTSCLRIREESEMMDLSNAREISYMDTAVEYGLNKIEYVVNDNGIHFLYLEKSQLNSILSQALKIDLVKNDAEYTTFINGIKGSLNSQGGGYIGKLGRYEGVEYTIKYVFKDLWYETDWSHHCEKFYYSITDGFNELVFENKDGKLINFDINPPGDESNNIVDGMHFNLSSNRRYYILTAYTPVAQNEEIELEIPATYKNKPVTTIANNAFRSNLKFKRLTIPETITYLGSNFVREIEELNYLGTVNQWVGIAYSSYNTFMTASKSFYIKGELLTNANITATRINDWAFAGCKSLTSVTLSDNIEYVGANSFAECSSLIGSEYGNAYYIGTPSNPYKVLVRAKSNSITTIQLHADTEILTGFALSNCTLIENVVLNNKLIKLGYGVFAPSNQLTELIIPTSVKAISAAVFGDAMIRQIEVDLIFEKESVWYGCSSDENLLGSTSTELSTSNEVIDYLKRGPMVNWIVRAD